jgi:hypothetical protein
MNLDSEYDRFLSEIVRSSPGLRELTDAGILTVVSDESWSHTSVQAWNQSGYFFVQSGIRYHQV